MQNKGLQAVLLITIILLIGCEQKTQADYSFLNKDSKQDTIPATKTLPDIDTTIIIKKQDIKKGEAREVNQETVKNALFQHYRKQKFCIDGEVPKGKSVWEDDLMCITFDTAYLVNLNCDSNLDAILQYWITPYGASGNCYQPHKAMLLNINNEFFIQNEDFIPDYYTVNQVEQTNNCMVTLYGVEWDCGTKESIRKFKVHLK
jgi:hypothetical protein